MAFILPYKVEKINCNLVTLDAGLYVVFGTTARKVVNHSKTSNGATALEFDDGCNFDVQVGNPTHDTSLEKASVIHRELIVGGLPYANAFEHCATPIDIETTSEGITHFDVNDIPYSGNFANWAQI